MAVSKGQYTKDERRTCGLWEKALCAAVRSRLEIGLRSGKASLIVGLDLQDQKVASEMVDCLHDSPSGGWWRSEIQLNWKQSLTGPAVEQETSMGTKLYVGNLSFSTMESDLQTLFRQAGNVVSCSLITDKFTGKSRGFAFVEMGSEAEAQKAIAELNGKDVDGRPLTVNEAKPREERPRRDFGGGGDRGGRDRRR
jgi:hypothetical protein